MMSLKTLLVWYTELLKTKVRGLVNWVKATIHQLFYSPGPNPKRVVIVGGSWAGYTVAKLVANSLPSGYAVTLVEKAQWHSHTFNFPRCSVVGGHENVAFIPFYKRNTRVTPKGSLDVIFDECVTATKDKIVLKSGKSIPYVALVIATGRDRPMPASLGTCTKDVGISKLRELQKRIEGSYKIAVIGAGAVGVELATDIKYMYGNAKEVHLYNSRPHVLPRFDKVVADLAEPEIIASGVCLKNNCRPTINGNSLILPDGSVETYDYILACTGEASTSTPFHDLLGDKITSHGTIVVDHHLQCQDNVFALGDVIEGVGPKMARAAFSQGNIVAKNVIALLTNKGMQKYVPQDLENALHLTLGLRKGLLHLPNADTTINEHDEDFEMSAPLFWPFFDVKYHKERANE